MQQPPAYPPQQPPMPAQYPADRPTNSLAIVSLVAGLASYVVVPVIGAVVAIITGHMARGQVRRTGEAGSGLALAGLILGYVHLLLVLIVVAIVAIIAITAGAAFFGASRH